MRQMKFNIVPLNQNTYALERRFGRQFLLKGKERALLIDTGWPDSDIKEVVEGMTDLPLIVANTHYHIDHVGSDWKFGDIWAHRDDMTGIYANQGGLPLQFYPLAEGDVIDLGDRKIHVMHTPGHTPGGLSFLDRESRELFPGDNLGTNSLFFTDPTSDPDAFLDSIHRLYGMRSEYDMIYPSHGTLTVQPEVVHNITDCIQAWRRGELVPGKGKNAVGTPCKTYTYHGALIFAPMRERTGN